MDEKKKRTLVFKKRLYAFVLKLIAFIEKLENARTTRVVGDQLLRSGTSVLANYVEAQASSSRNDYRNFLNHSLKSSNESKVWVAILRDTGYDKEKESTWLLSELDEFSKIFGASIITLRSKKSI